jgi:hypothetical protein
MEEGAEGGQEGQTGSPAALTPEDPHELGDSPAVAPARHRVAPFAIVLAVGAWLTRSFWMPGSYVVGFDTFAYSGPNLEITERALRNGRLAVLNDMIFGGVPHLGNPQGMALYLPQLLTIPFGTNRAMGLLVTFHVLLLGVGMVVLMRRLGVGAIGATAGGVVAMAGGASLTKTVQFEQISVVAWMPLLLAAIHAVLTAARPWRAVAALSATTAAVLLAGHPQLVYQTVIVALAATVAFAVDDRRWRRLGHVAAGAVLGACIALPQLWASLRATADSAITGGRDIDELLLPALSLTPRATARAMLGTVQDRDPAVFAGGFESIGFVGVAVALVAIVGFVAAVTARPSRPWAVAFGATGLVALVWAMGPRTVLFRLAFEILPGFDLARASARWIVVVALIAAIFAAVGVDTLWRGLRRAHVAAGAGAIGLLVALLALDVVDVADRTSALIWVVTAVVVMGLLVTGVLDHRPGVVRGVAVGVVVVAAAELALMSLHSVPQSLATDEPFTSDVTSTTDFLRRSDGGLTMALTDDGLPVPYSVPAMRPNANVLAEVPSIDGYDGGVQITERWADALRRFQPDPAVELPMRNSLTLPVDPDALARLGVRWVLLDRDRPADVFVPGWVGPVAEDADLTVWENPTWRGEAVIWPAAIASDDPAALLRDRPATAARAALVDDDDLVIECTGSACEPRGVAVDRPRPERIELAVDLDDPAVVSVAQQALPGWTVEVDGQRADVVVVDGLFAGVRLAEGRHEVAFVYRSPLLTVTLVIAVLALLASSALAITGTIPDPRRRRAQVKDTDDR